MIKIILVPVDGSERSAEVLKTAHIIARRFSAHIKVLHVRARSSEPYMFNELPETYRKEFEKLSGKAVDAVVEKVRQQFDGFCASAGVVKVDKPAASDKVSASLHILDGDPGSVLDREARLVDVIAMSRPTRHRLGGRGVGERLESLLMHSGRPVLIVPPEWEAQRTEHAAIGWNDSVEASRALAMTLPWLKQMSKVTVLVSKEREPGVGGVIEYLANHGVEAKVHLLNEKGGNAGERMLTACDEISADFLVVGGFSHTRTLQLLFGGATSHLLLNTDIITVMAH